MVTYKPRNIKYKIIETLVGDSKDTIEDEYFDVFFISVVENVERDMLKKFLLDSLRILKKDGVIITGLILLHTMKIYNQE